MDSEPLCLLVLRSRSFSGRAAPPSITARFPQAAHGGVAGPVPPPPDRHDVRQETQWQGGEGAVRQDPLAHLQARLRAQHRLRRPRVHHAEGDQGRLQRRDHGGARRARGGDRRLPHDGAPRLLDARGAHRRVESAQADGEVLFVGDGRALQLRGPVLRPRRAAACRRRVRHHHEEQAGARQRHHLRPRLHVRLLWLQGAPSTRAPPSAPRPLRRAPTLRAAAVRCDVLRCAWY